MKAVKIKKIPVKTYQYKKSINNKHFFIHNYPLLKLKNKSRFLICNFLVSSGRDKTNNPKYLLKNETKGKYQKNKKALLI